MSAAAWPLRVRLHGGRHTHAAKVGNGGEDDFTITACGHMVVPRDTAQDDTAPVTCRGCQTAMRRADA